MFKFAKDHVLSSKIIGDIKIWEGYRNKAYKDAALPPIWTIGYGHTAGVKQGHLCTLEQANNWLADDLKYAEDIVKLRVNVAISQGMYDALVSFIYNVGAGKKGVKDGFVSLKNGNQSTLLRLVNTREFEKAADEFLKWTRAGSAHPKGLIARRRKERQYFLQDLTMHPALDYVILPPKMGLWQRLKNLFKGGK